MYNVTSFCFFRKKVLGWRLANQDWTNSISLSPRVELSPFELWKTPPNDWAQTGLTPRTWEGTERSPGNSHSFEGPMPLSTHL